MAGRLRAAARSVYWHDRTPRPERGVDYPVDGRAAKAVRPKGLGRGGNVVSQSSAAPRP